MFLTATQASGYPSRSRSTSSTSATTVSTYASTGTVRTTNGTSRKYALVHCQCSQRCRFLRSEYSCHLVSSNSSHSVCSCLTLSSYALVKSNEPRSHDFPSQVNSGPRQTGLNEGGEDLELSNWALALVVFGLSLALVMLVLAIVLLVFYCRARKVKKKPIRFSRELIYSRGLFLVSVSPSQALEGLGFAWTKRLLLLSQVRDGRGHRGRSQS